VVETKVVSGYTYLSPNLYTATFKGFKEDVIRRKTETGAVKEQPVYRILYEIENGEQKVEMNELTDRPLRVTPKNKIGRLARALLGRDLQMHETIDWDKLVGKKIKVVIEDKEAGVSKIASYLPANGAGATPPSFFAEIEITKDCVRFLGKDMKHEFGPYKAGQIVLIPEEEAKLMVTKGYARRCERFNVGAFI
jgi:hypothetical protein